MVLEEWEVELCQPDMSSEYFIRHVPCDAAAFRYLNEIRCFTCGGKPPQAILDAALFTGKLHMHTYSESWGRSKQ